MTMNNISIAKVVLSISSTGDNLNKGTLLLERLTGRKPARKKSTKRIPALGVRPGLEVGSMVTLRGDKALEMLKKLLVAEDNFLKKRKFSDNSFSFGIKEYIEIPGMQYQRDIGIIGFDVSVAFERPGKRVIRKKIKQGRLPRKQQISKEEIMNFMKEHFHVEIK